MFVDEATIFVEGGRGGDGCVSFRREKYKPRGGPDGGSGGRGGDVLITSSNHRATLLELKRKSHFRGGRGGNGGPRKMTGARGDDVEVQAPPGTLVKDPRGMVLADLVEPGQSFIAASGGRGGRGNSALKKEAGPAPGFAEKGEPGHSRRLELELKLVADAALVGFPNAGKSSLIACISAARPEIADYPFTTTEPNLGVVEGEHLDYVVTDVPGLIEGAHRGRGMGTDFLRHIERANVILYMIDMSPYSGRDPLYQLVTLEEELSRFNPDLGGRKRLVVANKMDLKPDPGALESLERECASRDVGLLKTSVATTEGLAGLVARLEQMVEEGRSAGRAEPHEVVYRAEPDEDVLTVRREADGWLVRGGRVERMVRMTDWGNDDALAHLARRLKDLGVEDLLRREGAAPGDRVEIAGRVFEYSPDREPGSFGADGDSEDG